MMKQKRNILTLVLALASLTAVAQQNGTWNLYDTRSSEICGNNIAAIAGDNKGVWVGTYMGLCRLNGGSWMDYAMFNEKLKDQSINCLMVDSRGVVWIGTDDYGVIEFDGTHWTEYTTEARRRRLPLD